MIYIDTKNKNRIIVGENKKTDWVNVECIGHIDKDNNFIRDWCDSSKIEKIQFNPEINKWIIFKKKSTWEYTEGNIYNAELKLLERDGEK